MKRKVDLLLSNLASTGLDEYDKSTNLNLSIIFLFQERDTFIPRYLYIGKAEECQAVGSYNTQLLGRLQFIQRALKKVINCKMVARRKHLPATDFFFSVKLCFWYFSIEVYLISENKQRNSSFVCCDVQNLTFLTLDLQTEICTSQKQYFFWNLVRFVFVSSFYLILTQFKSIFYQLFVYTLLFSNFETGRMRKKITINDNKLDPF